MENPFLRQPQTPPSAEVPRAQIDVDQNSDRFWIRFTITTTSPLVARIYQRAAWVTLEEWTLMTQEPLISKEHPLVIKTRLRKDNIKDPEELHELIAKIHESAQDPELIEYIKMDLEAEEREHKEIEQLRAELGTQKAPFLQALIDQRAESVPLPVSVRFTRDRGRQYLNVILPEATGLIPDIATASIKQTIESFGQFWPIEQSEGTERRWKTDNDPDRDEEVVEQTMMNDIRSAFINLTKNGPGRNKIKLELKRMDPNYQTREQRSKT